MNENVPGLVSVIIPTYKRADKLKRAIESALNQTYDKLEVLVINDNNPGDVYSLELEKLISSIHDNRLFLIEQEKHINGAAARNTGIKKAKGEFIAFLDDDDTWSNEKIEYQVKMFNNFPELGLVTTGVYYVYVNEKITYESIPNANGDVSKEILISNCVGGTQAMVRKELLEKVGGFDEKLNALQDYELWIRICQLAKVGTVRKPLIYYYNYRGTTQISQVTKNYEIAFNYITKKHSNLFMKLSSEEKKSRESAEYLLLANKAMRNNNRKSALRYVIKAFSAKPSLKAFIYGIISIFDYKIVLKLRKTKKFK